MGIIKDMVKKWLNIVQSPPNAITITASESHETNVLKNKIWYRGDPCELEQLYKQLQGITPSSVGGARFWASSSTKGLQIRKIHSGLPSMIVDKLTGLIISDMLPFEFDDSVIEQDIESFNEIARDNKIDDVFKTAISETLTTGDGAFKISIDPTLTQYPIIEFINSDRVKFVHKRGRLQEIQFFTFYKKDKKTYTLTEKYGYGYVSYNLVDNDTDKSVPLTVLQDTNSLIDVTFDNNVILAVPMMFYQSTKYSDRGKGIYDTKTEIFDALDEIISQWLDAVRQGRVSKYIPDNLIPRDPDNGAVLFLNPFDNQYISLDGIVREGTQDKIEVIQPKIDYNAYIESYSKFLDQALQGILSPSTLGIDLKKMDNAEAQREKEKTTLSTRAEIISVLQEVLPRVVDLLLKTYDIMMARTCKEYICSASFGEYATPSFDSMIETIGKAKSMGIMSIEKAVDELYGKSMTDEDKEQEVERIKLENAFDYPSTLSGD